MGDQRHGSLGINDEVEIKAIIVDMSLVMDVLDAVGEATKAALDPFFTEYSKTNNTEVEPFSIEKDFLASYAVLSSRQRVQKCLEVRGITLPFGHLDDGTTARTICGLDAGYRAELILAINRGIPRKEKAIVLLQQLKQRGCRIGVLYNGHHGKHLLRSARIANLVDSVVDGAVVEKFDLRRAPEADIVLKCCTDMGVSPYEAIVISPYGYQGCAAGASGNLGLVLGYCNPRDPTPVAKQEEELYVEGADMVVDISELTGYRISELYSKHLSEDAWRLSYRAFLPGDERLREAMTSVGNGYLGNRAAFETERCSKTHYPATYIAPVYDTAPSDVKGRTIYNSDMVNIPNWCLIQLKIGSSDWVSPFDKDCRILSYSHSLNFRDGCLQRTIVFRDPQGRQTTIQTARIVSMHAYHVCAIQFTVIPENYDEEIVIRSSIDGDIVNDNVPRYGDLTKEHLNIIKTCAEGEDTNGVFMSAETIYTKIGLSLYAKHSAWVLGREQTAMKAKITAEEKIVSADFTFEGKRGTSYTVEKLVSIFSSEDHEFNNHPNKSDRDACLKTLALAELEKANYFIQLLEPHKRVWADIWDKSDIVVDGDRFVQTMIRAHTYHLIITASSHRALVDAGLPARGLSGEGYRGHVFWDEVYMFPFYLSKFPEVAKSHLAYRIKRLPQARAYAKENGYQGAMYPWQTSDTGNEETQVVHYNPVSGLWDPDDSCRQRHVSIAIFVDGWRYWHETQDREFLESSLAEMMLSISIFWQSIAEFEEADGKYHISGVMGPDEFHEMSEACGHGVKDNAYTNVMVVWVFQRTQELLDALSPEAKERIIAAIGLTDEILNRMKDIRTKLCVNIENGILEQFKGYMKLKELDWGLYRKKYKSIKRIDRILKAEGLTPDDYKVAKQPDSLMLYYLLTPGEINSIMSDLGYEIEDDIAFLRKNYDYYLARTSHGSTLSFTVMAKIAQMCGRADFEWEWFMEAAKSDIYDRQGTTHEGIHCAVMAGTIDIIISNFVGLRENTDSSYSIRPALPTNWQSVSFKRLLQGQWYEFTVTKKDVKITLVDGFSSDEPTGPFYIGNNKIMVCPWSPITVEYNTIVSVKNFFDLMWKTKFVRQSIVDEYFEGCDADPGSVAVLRYALQSLKSAPKSNRGMCQLVLDKRRRVEVEMTYEMESLEKDLHFLEKEDQEFMEELAQLPYNTDFEKYLKAGVEFLGNTRFHNFITDRDGTTNMYCGRYVTSIQAVYNAVWLATFSKQCCENSLFMTSAPLHGLKDVSIMPDGTFIHGCSKGKEFLGKHGTYHSTTITPEQQKVMFEFNMRMKQILKRPEYEKFALIGSGLQIKFAQTTIARSDHAKSIPEDESSAFTDLIKRVASEVGGANLSVHSTEYDIEISPAEESAAAKTWTKGDGVCLVDQQVGLQLEMGPNLICGDTVSDLPMVEVAMQRCPEKTLCIFVTTNEDLADKVRAICPQTLIVPSPDILVAILYQCAKNMGPALGRV
jgi:trehalose/maltose hydrolase-like predicted phosphorylase/beta-phosphoglucomutase-like phosphatase (HAD superfamily)